MKRLTIKFVVIFASFFIGIATATLWVSKPPKRFADDIYFSIGTFALSESEGRMYSKVKFYSSCLAAMGEPSFSTSYKDKVEAYRFVLLLPFDSPVSVRLWRDGEQYYISAKQLTAPERLIGGEVIYPKTLRIDKTRSLTVEEWDMFQNLLKKVEFWSMPTEDGSEGSDGASFLLEGCNSSQYHVVERWSPKDERFFNACAYLLKISELKVRY